MLTICIRCTFGAIMLLAKRIALVFALLTSAPALAQVTPGTSPLSGAKGGTNNAFTQFTGPAASLKTFTLPNVSGTIALLGQSQTWTAAQSFTNGGALSGTFSGTPTFSGSNFIVNSNLAQMAAGTVKCNPTVSTANAQDCASPVINFGKYLTTGLMPIRFDIAKNCTVDPTGTNDMGACVNSTISDAVAALTISGSGLATTGAVANVIIPCGTFKISTQIILKSWVKIVGGGRGCTVLNAAVSSPITTDPTHQTIFSGLSDVSIRCGAGCTSSWTGLQLYSVEASNFTVLEITGFSTGTGIGITPLNASVTVQYASGFFGTGGNTIFNNFKDIVIQTVRGGITYAGHYNGTSCDILTTDNVFDKVVMIQVQFGVAITNCADSNHFSAFQYYGITAGVCLTIGNDASTTDHGSYQLYFDGLCSSFFGAGIGTLTFIVSNGTSWGHHIHIQTDDIAPLTGSVGPYGACVTKSNSTQILFADLELPGKCNPNIPADVILPFAPMAAAILGGDSMYFQASGISTNAAPAYSFYGDNTNGVYRVATGTAGFSKNLRIDGHLLSGAGSTPTLSACGTSPAFAGTASDTAGRVTVGSGPPTSCTITFGAAFNTAPVCVFTAVGVIQQPYVSAQSTTAITWTWAVAQAGQQFNYACIALPGG